MHACWISLVKIIAPQSIHIHAKLTIYDLLICIPNIRKLCGELMITV